MVFRAQVRIPCWRYGDHCDHSYPGLLRDGCSEKSKSILPSLFLVGSGSSSIGWPGFRRTSINSFGRWCSLPWAVLHWAKLSSAAVCWKPWMSSSERWSTACRCTASFFCSPVSFWYVAYVMQCFLFSLTRVIRLFPRSSATQLPAFCWCRSPRKSELTCQAPQPVFSSS